MNDLDAMMKRFTERKPAGPKEQEQRQGESEPAESGVEKFSQPELTINDLAVRFEPKRLGDHLPVFGNPEDIIKINKEHPEYLDAVRTDDGTGCTGKNCSNS